METATHHVHMREFKVNDVRIRVAALLLIALALSACGRTGIKVSSSPQPTAAPGAPTLLVRLDEGNDDRGVRQHLADYLSDGTVVRWANNGPACEPGRPCGVLETNTLTAAGLAALRTTLASDADLLAAPRNFKRYLLPGKSAPRGTTIHTFVLDDPDGSRYSVGVPSSRSYGAGDWVADPVIDRLGALADVMLHPETLIGSEGLAHAWTTYQPVKMALFIRTGAISPAPTPMVDNNGAIIGMPFPTIGTHDVSQSWPFESTPDTFGMAFTWSDGLEQRCGFVDSADVETLAAIVPPGSGGTLARGMLAMGRSWGSGGLGWEGKMYVQLRIVALLPEDISASCADAMAY